MKIRISAESPVHLIIEFQTPSTTRCRSKYEARKFAEINVQSMFYCAQIYDTVLRTVFIFTHACIHIYCAAHKFYILLQYFIAVGLKQCEIQYETFSRVAHAKTRYIDLTKTQ